MTKMSFIDKLGVLVEVSKSSNLFIVAIFILGIIGYLFFSVNKKNMKKSRRLYLGAAMVVLVLTLAIYKDSITDMFDYMMNNFFIAVYFPNVAIYLAAIIITNIILYVSIFSYKTSTLIKNINITIYCILNYILILLLNVIVTKKLDVFTQASIYQNKQAHALIELSSIIFIVWILFLIAYRLIMIYLKKEYKVPVKIKKVYVKQKVPILPENITPVEVPRFAKAMPKTEVLEEKQETKEEVKEEKQETKEDLIVKKLEESLTLDDYKLLLKMLKEQRQKERLERIKKQQEYDEQVKFRELQELYRSVK